MELLHKMNNVMMVILLNLMVVINVIIHVHKIVKFVKKVYVKNAILDII